MSYGESLLARDEQILYRARQHWLAPASDSVRPAVLVLAGLLLLIAQLNVGPGGLISTIWTALWAILLLVGLGWIGIIYGTWHAEEYLITTRRALKIEGLLDKKASDSSLEKINDAVLSQGLLARLLHYGDLEILTASEEAIDCYQMLAHPVDFKKAMLNAKNTLEDGGRQVPSSAWSTGPTPVSVAAGHQMSSDDVTRTLAQLADLRDKGAITQAEYESKKADLLGRL
jgi:uncharacterized membrane protein YdbT with pleckstrin-like domain